MTNKESFDEAIAKGEAQLDNGEGIAYTPELMQDAINQTLPREIWVVYKTLNRGATGWEERVPMPGGGCTDIIKEEWSYSPDYTIFPGDRPREYKSINGATYGRDADWVVVKVERFVSPGTDKVILVCYCEESPSESEWEEISRLRRKALDYPE